MIRDAVLEVLSPFINEAREVLESIKRAVGSQVEGIDLNLDILDSNRKMKVLSLNMDHEHYVQRNITSFNNPPYFTKQLPNPTTYDRICWLDNGNL